MIEFTRTYRAVADAFHYCRIIASEEQICEFARFLCRHDVVAKSDVEFVRNLLKREEEKRRKSAFGKFVYWDTDSIFLEPKKD